MLNIDIKGTYTSISYDDGGKNKFLFTLLNQKYLNAAKARGL